MMSEVREAKGWFEDVLRAAWTLAPHELSQSVHTVIEGSDGWHESALDLVAARNVMSPAARRVLASGMADTSQPGTVGKRPYGGSFWVDELETLTVEMAKRLFDVQYVEYRPVTGAVANAVALLGLLEGGERVLAVSPRHGGDDTTWKYGVAGRLEVTYEEIVHGEGGFAIDLEAAALQVQRFQPHWIILGSAAPRFPYPVRELADLARGVGGRVFYDGAHTVGLMAGGEYQHPLNEGSIVLTGSTQKTLPGPVGGLILTDDPEVAERIAKTTDSVLSTYQNNRVAALAITLAEMLAFGEEYAQAVVRNAQALARNLDERGFHVLGKEGGFTASHIAMIDLTEVMSGEEAIARLEQARIICSKSPLPDSYPQRLGLRSGTAGVTRLGMGPGEMNEVADLLARTLLDREDEPRVAKDVAALVSGFRTVQYCW